MKKFINRAMALLISGLMLFALLPATPARAAVTTVDNPIMFAVRGSVVDGTVKYNISINDIFAQSYQSFTVIYPAELTINYSALATVWTLTSDTTGSPRNLTAIIKSGSRTAAQLKTDLESISFTLAETDKFPPDGSTVSITADKEKVTLYQDAEGYLHFYKFVSGATNWFNAYNAAKTATMQDPRFPDDPTKVLHGYLATITSEAEQMQVYSAIAKDCGWLGGTRMVKTGTGTPKIKDDASIATAASSFDTGTANGKEWYWADGPEAWTVYNITTAGYAAGGPAYQYYPSGMTTVPSNAWSIYNSDTKAYTYYGAYDTEPVPAKPLSNVQSLVIDPNRGKSVGPLVFYTRVTSAGSTGDGAATGVYHNFNNTYGYDHFFNSNGKYVGRTKATGAEPNNSGTEYCLQFAYTSGSKSLTAVDPDTGSSATFTNAKPDTWNDFAATSTTSMYGYYVEFGGYGNDPKADEMYDKGVGTTSEVEIVMPIIVQYRSTVISSYDDDGNPIYRQITGVGTKLDRVITYATTLPFTATRNAGSTGAPNNITPDNIPNYETYGYQFFGQNKDKVGLTINGAGDVSGYHSTNMQRIVFLYRPNTLTVTYNANFLGASSASTSVASKIANYDSPYGTLATATRVGYTLTGWNANGDGLGNVSGGAVLPATIVTNADDHTLFAGWTEKSGYTVKYNLNGGDGSFPVRENVKWTDGGFVPVAVPTREDFIFTGWDVSDGGTKQGVKNTDTYSVLATNDAITEITLKAQWLDIKKILVIYHLNGATSPTVIPNAEYPIEDFVSSMIVTLPTTTRTGYTFGGWTVVNNGAGVNTGITVSNQTYETLAAENAQFIILEAQWTPKLYTVNYDNNGGANPVGTSKSNVLWSQNGLVPPDTGEPKWLHNIFMGWNTAADGSGASVYNGTPYSQLVSDDSVSEVKLYAQWQAEPTYQVRYETNGGEPSSIAAMTVHLGDKDLLPPSPPTPPTGYDFSTWSVSANGTKSGVTADDTFGSLAENPSLGYITLTAQYSPKSGLTVSYNLNGASGAAPAAITGVVWTQKKLIPDSDPANVGKVFVGWNTMANGSGRFITNADTFGSIVDMNDKLTSATLFAQWADATTYTVRYDLNGGTSDSITNVTLYDLADIVPAPLPTAPAGYTFVNWVVADNGYGQTGNQTNPIIPDGETITYSKLCYGGANVANAAKYILLKAVYEERSDFAVTYNPNYDGAVAGSLTGVKWTQNGFVPVPESVALNVSNPGHNLLGWTTDAGGSNTFVQSATQYSDLTGGNDTVPITLYAQWENAHFLVNYDLNGGFAVGTDSFGSTPVGFDDTGLVPVAIPKRIGFQLSGWSVSKNGSKDNVTNGDSFRSLADPGVTYITLQAKWVAKEYAVKYDSNGGLPADILNLPVKWSQDNLLPALTMTRTGYSFVDWALSKQENDTAVTQAVDGATKYSDLALRDDGYDYENITLQAQWIAKSNYKVNYDLNYTNAPSFAARENVKWTDTVLPTEPPTRAGWTLTGWTFGTPTGSAVAGTDLYSALVGNNDATTEIYLYAQWVPKTYTVKYLPGSVTLGATDENGNAAGTYDAYWWKNYPTDGPDDVAEKGAKKTAIPDYSGITWSAVETPDTAADYKPAESVVIPPRWLYIDALGYHFAGWKLSYDGRSDVDVTESSVIPGPNPLPFSSFAHDDGVEYITITGTWAKSYAVFYDLEGGNYDGATVSVTNYYTSLTDEVTTLHAPKRAGFSFSGWKLTKLEAATVDGLINYEAETKIGKYEELAATPSEGVAPNVTLAAQWTEDAPVAINYAVKTRANDGKAQDDDFGGYISSPTNGSQSVLPATGTATATVVGKSGYSFVGWFAASDASYATSLSTALTFSPAKVGGLNVVGSYVALFEENANVAITYAAVTVNAASGTAGGTVDSVGESLAPATGNALGATATFKPGYTFIGWFARQEAGHDYLNDTPLADEVFAPAKVGGVNVAGNYVAVFKENADVTIKYGALTYTNKGALTTAAVGGIVDSSGEELSPATGTAVGTTAAASAGYTFKGWFARAEEYDYLNNTPIVGTPLYAPAKVGELNVDGDYVAVFQENADAVITYTVKTHAHDGTAQADGFGGSIVLPFGGSQSVPPATGNAQATVAAKSGYKLVGWYAASDTGFTNKFGDGASFAPAKVGELNVSGDYVALFEEDEAVEITYAAVTEGESDGTTGGIVHLDGDVNLSGESLAPATGVALGAIATANIGSGYELIGWYELGTDYASTEPITPNATFVPTKSADKLNFSADYVAYFRLKVYGAEVRVYKDGVLWNDDGAPTISVKKNDAGDAISDLSTLLFGEYMIYANDVSTGVWLTVDNSTNSTQLSYYTVVFDVADAGDAVGSTVSATYNGEPIESGDIVLGGGALKITAAGDGAYNGAYAYLWSGSETDGETTAAQFTAKSLGNRVDALCTVTGTHRYTFRIRVIDDAGKPLENATVAIDQSGKNMDNGATDTGGIFVPNNLPAGYYNAVVSYKNGEREIVANKLIHITEDGERVIQLTLGNGLGSLGSEFNQVETVPTVAAGDLDDVYIAAPAENATSGVTAEDKSAYEDGGRIWIRLEAEDVNDEQQIQRDEIETLAFYDGKGFAFELDLSAYKDVTLAGEELVTTTRLAELNSLVDICIYLPVADQGQTGYAVYRWHNGSAERLPQFPVKNSVGEYFQMSADSTMIILTVKRFSVYMVAYNKADAVAEPITVTLDENYESKLADAVKTVKLLAGESHSLPVPTRDGYNFLNWATEKDGGGNIYPAEVAIVFEKDTTLYAQWERVDNSGNSPDFPTTADSDDEPESEPPKPPLNKREHFAYIVGYPDGNVRPDGLITRAETATILFRLLEDNTSTDDNNFTDAQEGQWFNTAVSTLAKLGVMKGYPDGSVKPESDITRAEFVALVARFFEAPVGGSMPYGDVPTGHWATEYIISAYNAGIIQGYPDGTFRPESPISRAEAITIINRLLDRHVETEDELLPDMTTWRDNADAGVWYYFDIQEATNSHNYVREANSASESWTEVLPVLEISAQ
ncbi:MAG: InlB B-repeat-containing protein [Oscillospiraceae bacterium]|jgi:hypothetical protein|nr:InlB B-repeat-containing protein [Oscillospiraceae bacterium]